MMTYRSSLALAKPYMKRNNPCYCAAGARKSCKNTTQLDLQGMARATTTQRLHDSRKVLQELKRGKCSKSSVWNGALSQWRNTS